MFEWENIDYYSGFEGEAEIIFKVQVEQKTFEFKMWIGYFESILSNVCLVNPKNNRFLKLYYLYEGWYDDSPFEIENINEVIEVFNNFEVENLTEERRSKLNSLIPELNEVKERLVEFLEFAIVNGCSVTISYE